MKLNDLYPSRYLKAEAVPKPTPVTITDVREEAVDQDGTRKPVMYFAEFGERGMVLNITNASLAQDILGSDETSDWVGHQVTLFNDPSVTYGGKRCGGLRLRALAVHTKRGNGATGVAGMDEDVPNF